MIFFHSTPAFILLVVVSMILSVNSFQFQQITRKFTPLSSRMQLYAQLGRVTMYKKEGCPYCVKAISLLEGKYGLDINYVDIKEPDE